MAESPKKIAIGISDFKRLIQNDYYFVDKTRLILHVLEFERRLILELLDKVTMPAQALAEGGQRLKPERRPG